MFTIIFMIKSSFQTEFLYYAHYSFKSPNNLLNKVGLWLFMNSELDAREKYQQDFAKRSEQQKILYWQI